MAQDTIPAAGDENGSRQETTPFSAPQISLPKGGGAIHGIGEKFAANPVTGTGSLTVPIAVSPGRSGFGPQLSLSYDSGTGNGPFGLGWNLALPSITRKTDKGLPRYQDGDESDVFILSGAEDLVPAFERDCDGELVHDEFERAGYMVKRYRPRIEGLFARIECWTRLCDGDTHWRSISKDNILSVYGGSAESRISDPANARHTFSWLICQSYDDTGNAILYEYAAENHDGIDFRHANERNRVRTANRYLKRIKYGNRKPLLVDVTFPSFRKSHLSPHALDAADWMFEVVLDYGDEIYRERKEAQGSTEALFEATSDQTRPPWPARKDPFSTYRAGFEVRMYRLCRRVLVLHNFADELGVRDYLVKGTEFEYREKPIGSFISRVIQSGFKRQATGAYLKKSLPALDLSYTSSPLEAPGDCAYEVKDVDPASLANLPAGIDGTSYRWVDLNGEGISGVLSEQANAWFYKPNLGNSRFGPVEAVAPKPSLAALNSGRQQLLDLGGEGKLDLAEFTPGAPGFYERTTAEGWKAFRRFRSLPIRDWSDPNLRFIDITGDGIADVLITEDEAFIWHPSLGKRGFGSAVRIHVPLEEEKGAHVVFADGTQSIYTADMSGDGQADLVRIRNGEVCYWPNLGYGRFGPKVTMDNSPWFDETDLFDQRRIRLADTDGSGTTDILYLGRDGVRVFLNEVGNGWSSARVLRKLPSTNDLIAVSVTDFLGRGTACLVWSSPLLRDSQRPLRYVDLMEGRKPHLLTRVQNNLGAETIIEYDSSTEFYLADKAAGTPWITRLTFPVHVVKRIETFDHVSRNRFVTRYSYHHGYFDGPEREFRGFGRVDQLDTEEFAALSQSGNFPTGDNVDAASHVPPVLTKTWFHTGAFLEGRRISRHFEHEYYREGLPRCGEAELGQEEIEAMELEDTVLPHRLSPEEAREACRSLKGSALRQEVYALDGKEESRRPYTVVESNYTIRPLQPRGRNRHAVFFIHPRESISFNYERKLYTHENCRRADPRVTHGVTLRVDDFGNILQSASIGYGRRFPDSSDTLSDADRDKQIRLLLTLTENRYTNPVLAADAYRIPLLAETKVYELIKLKPAARRIGVTNLFRFGELAEQVERASEGAHDLPYEDVHARGATLNEPYRRLLKGSRSLYRSNHLDQLLPLGALQSLALPGESYKLAFTPGLLEQVYQRPKANHTLENLLPDPSSVLGSEAGYVDLDGDGHWWIPSGRLFYSPASGDGSLQELSFAAAHFFLPYRFTDPYGNIKAVRYDLHNLALIEVRDPVDNTVQARNDYRVLALTFLTDPNGNRSHVAFDALGMVVGTAVMGKEEEKQGDSLEGFVEDLDESSILEHVRDPLRNPHQILQSATTRLVYDLFAFARTRHDEQPQPAVVYTLARETHVADLGEGSQTKIQHAFSYSDGFAREIQKKIQAEHGADKKPRWVGSGWTIFNNKGKTVRQYEPFFSPTQHYEFATIVGVSPILFYDPVERVIATLYPNHTYAKVVFDPWRQEIWDINDTVLQTDPATDPDVSDFFLRLPRGDYSPTWYAQRIGGTLGIHEQDAALKSRNHAGTPTIAHFDTLARSFLTIADNGNAGKYPTRVELDIEDNQRAVRDATAQEGDGQGRIVMRYEYDLLKNCIHRASMDAGERWMLNDVTGKAIRMWDSRGHNFRSEYDALRRPANLLVLGTYPGISDPRTLNSEILYEKTNYGEGRPDPELLNLRTRIFQHYDAAGVVLNMGHNPVTNRDEAYDFKGNLLRSSRQFVRDCKAPPNWFELPAFQSDTYASSTQYDALNRPIAATTPDESVFRATYNEANLLETVDVNLRGAQAATVFVANIDYDAKGQRVLIEYGNHTATAFIYDPKTFRLVQRTTTRTSFPPNQQVVQDLLYTYDPIGNVTHIKDNADIQNIVFFRNRRVEPSSDYNYDAIYQLIRSSGREQLGLNGSRRLPPWPTSYNDVPRVTLLSPGDGNGVGTYTEQYQYDAVGNFLKIIHQGANPAKPGWIRTYSYNESSLLESGKVSNRLTSTAISGNQPLNEPYTSDLHGNMTSMPQLQAMQWNFKDELHMTRRQAVNNSDQDGIQHQGERTYYVYDATGHRMRKTTESSVGIPIKERLYLGGFEVYREFDAAGNVTLVRESLHIMDDKTRVALVETKTVDIKVSLTSLPSTATRYQFDNHLGTACLELDENAEVISYEEYYPFGGTSYQAGRTLTEVSLKRYRYTGKERDEETGFNYHGARYYISWLGRWTGCDPARTDVSLCPYNYVANNPLKLIDPKGESAEEPDPKGGLARQLLNSVSAGAHAITEGAIWNPTVWGDLSRNARMAIDFRRGVILEKFAGNVTVGGLGRITGGLGRFAKDADRATATVVQQIKSTSSFARVAQITRNATRDAARFIANDASYAGRAAQARIILPTGTPGTVVQSAENALSRLAKPISGAVASPKVTTGLPGIGGIALKALAPVGAALSAHALGEDLAKKDYAAAVSDTAFTVAGGLETFALASTALGAGGTATASVGATATAGVALSAGGGGAAAAASVAAPVVAAFGIGVAIGTGIEKSLNVSDYASEHGIQAQEFAKRLGAGETTAFVAGAVVTVVSTPLAIQEAAEHKAAELATRAWNWLKH
ncbi:MAG: toxin [Acidobacteriia bacterium]|nr:toxin [Terriglobia bacterium]